MGVKNSSQNGEVQVSKHHIWLLASILLKKKSIGAVNPPPNSLWNKYHRNLKMRDGWLWSLLQWFLINISPKLFISISFPAQWFLYNWPDYILGSLKSLNKLWGWGLFTSDESGRESENFLWCLHFFFNVFHLFFGVFHFLSL